ncbi:hypothetical protein B0H10DRAFT_1724450, partial [Mycena sp. CBHHK59/15]
FLHLVTADGPGMAMIDRLVGHTGAYGCRIFSPVKSRHKARTSTYYLALLKPDNYLGHCFAWQLDVSGRNLSPGLPEEYLRALRTVMQSKNDAQHSQHRLGTGISKPTIFSGLPLYRVLSVPGCFPGDMMHLNINIFEVLTGLWRGSLDCD